MNKVKSTSLRIHLTIREGSLPLWFDLLLKVESGKVRSDIVRAHLSPPSQELMQRYCSAPSQEAPQRKNSEKTVQRVPESENPPKKGLIQEKLTVAPTVENFNSREESPRNGGEFSKETNATIPAEDSPTIGKVNSSEPLTGSPYRQSGLANRLLGNGLKFKGES